MLCEPTKENEGSSMNHNDHSSSSQWIDPKDTTDTVLTVLARITLLPVEDEEDDFETIALVDEIRDQLLSSAATLPTYTARPGFSDTRDAGIILLLGEIARQAIAHQTFVIELFKAGASAISLLVKQGHTKRIEITLDGDVLVVDNPDKVTEQTLLASWEAKHPGKALPSSTTIEVTGTLSKS